METEIVRNGDTFFAHQQKQLMNQKIVNKTLNNFHKVTSVTLTPLKT